jgi:hypothetical protein
MLIVPTQPIPSQTLQVTLSGQSCVLNIYQRLSGLYMDVFVDGGATAIIGGVICENDNRIVRDLYLGFDGDFVWLDNSGDGDDPYYTGFGAQFSLAYLEPADLDGYG